MGASPAAELKLLRRVSGLTLDEIAAQTGVSPGHFANLEHGHRRVPVAVLDRVRRVLRPLAVQAADAVIHPSEEEVAAV